MNMRKLIFTLVLLCSSFLLKAQTTVFIEDFETPPGSMTSTGTPGWFINSRIQASGVNCDSSTIAAPGDVSYLETPSFSTFFNFFVTLEFQSICKIEFFDNGIVEISIDGGNTWEQLRDDAGGSNNNCNYLGTGLFRTQGSRFQEASYAAWLPGNATAVPDNSWWQTETFDISNIAGNQPDVRIRFKNADGNNSGGASRTGWYVDDIRVVMSFCELIPPVAYGLSPNYPATVYNLGPFPVNIAATDASGIATATINWSLNGVAQAPISMTNPADSTWTGSIPAVDTFDVVCYNIEILDASACNNITYFPGPTANDSVCFSVEAGISFPYCDNFELQTGLWVPSTLTPGNNWEWGTPAYGATTGAHSPVNAWDINLTTAYTNSATTYLRSPEFSFIPTGAGATLEFWQNRATEGAWDGVRLEYTTDTILGPWTVLGSVGCIDCVNWYNNPSLISSGLPAWDGNSGGWVKSSIILDASFNGLAQVWFRFVFTSDASVIVDGFSIDDFCIFLPQPDDVGATAVVQPGTTGPAGSCINFETVVKNYGLNTQTTFPVNYQIYDQLGNPVGPVVTAPYTGNLTPGATANFTFPVCDTVPQGPFSVCFWTSLPGDGNNFNDTTCASSIGIPVFQLTACDDMENGNLGYQTTTTNTFAMEWQLGTPAFGVTTGAHSGTNAWDINLVTGYGTGTTATLTTPIYDMQGSVNPYLSFWRNQRSAGGDGLRIYYEINGNGTWTILGAVGTIDGYNWYNNTNINFSGLPGWDGTSNGWLESRYYLQNILFPGANFLRFRFEFVSGFNGAPNDGVSIDDICVKQPGPNDVGVVAIVEPGPNAPAGGTSNVTVTIRNFGSATQTSIPVSYDYGTGPVFATYNGSLAPGAIVNFPMPQFTVPSGQFGFCAWTELAGDSDNSNDTTCINSVGVPVIPLSYTSPYNDDFDGVNVGWSTLTPGNTTTNWELGPPAFGTTNSAHSTPNAWDINLNSAYGNNANTELYTPIFDLSNAVDPKLSFWRNHTCEGFWDGTRLEYSINGGPWTVLGTANSTAPCWVNWYTNAALNSSGLPGWDGATGGWVKTEATCLTLFDNVGLVQFRFIFTSDASVIQDGFSIDDFRLDIPVPLTAAPITVNTNTINSSFIFPGQPVQFSSPILNPGTTPLDSVQVTITITPAGGTVPIVTYTDPVTYSPALPSQQNLVHIFSQLWTAAPGVYDVCAITSFPNGSPDLNPFDDTVCVTISVFDSVSVTSTNPYCTDFESGPQWVSVNALTYNSTQNAWELGTPNQTIINGANSGSNAWTIDLDGNYQNRDTSGLFTPVFSIIPGKCYKLSFQHKFDTEPFADGGTVEYSTDYAQTWSHLGFASGTPQPWFNTPFITALGGSPGLPGWSGTEANWVPASQEVQLWGGNTVIFRFRFASDNTVNNYEGWAIDDVCFEEVTPCVTGIQEPGVTGLFLGQNMPNPFSGNSVIAYYLPKAGEVKIRITNLLGEEVAVPVSGEKDAGSHSFTLNARQLATGIYYYTLEFEGQQITRKMIITE
jgi:hypothetical protein